MLMRAREFGGWEGEPLPPRRKSWRWHVVVAAQRGCPRCGKGKVFASLWKMREECPVCGLRFQREEGYFIGAMYVSYFLAGLIGVPVALGLFWAGADPLGMVAGAAVVLFPLTPWLFQYSRVLWLHLDHFFDPA